MKLRVKMFAMARDLANASEVEVTLRESATVADLKVALQTQLPALQPLMKHLMFAVNSSYATDTTWLAPDADVACIPPVSGG
jgi:molybdopterin converting factor subunit 1